MVKYIIAFFLPWLSLTITEKDGSGNYLFGIAGNGYWLVTCVYMGFTFLIKGGRKTIIALC